MKEPTLESLCRCSLDIEPFPFRFNLELFSWFELHRLKYCFLDLPLGIFRGRKQYEPPRYMTINTAIEQLLEVEQLKGESGEDQNGSFVA